MSEIKNVGLTWMAKCSQLTHRPFEGLTFYICEKVAILPDASLSSPGRYPDCERDDGA